MTVGIDRVRRFWEDHVNNEYYTRQVRGSDEYFGEIEARRYRHHYHLPPLFDRMAEGAATQRLLEVGCGIGIDTVSVARRGFRRVVGVDLTPVSVAMARRRVLRAALPNLSLEAANAEALPFPDAAFDVVYSFGVLHHTPDVQRGVAEVHRVLAPGGTAHVMLYHSRSLVELLHRALRLPYESPRNLRDHCPVVYRFTRAEARGLFRDFSEVRITAAYPFTYGMRHLARFVPRRIERWLGQRIGWHLMIEAKKADRGAAPTPRAPGATPVG